VNWVVRSDGGDLIVVVGMDALEPFDIFEELSSKVKLEFLFFTASQVFFFWQESANGVVLCAALLHTKMTASKAPPPTRFIKYAMGDVGRLCLLVLSVSSLNCWVLWASSTESFGFGSCVCKSCAGSLGFVSVGC
jgi:hypothetical protein